MGPQPPSQRPQNLDPHSFPMQPATPLSTSLLTLLVPQVLLPSWLFFKASCTQPSSQFYIPPREAAVRMHLSSKLYPLGAAESRKIDVPSPATLQPPVAASENPDSGAPAQRTWVSESKGGRGGHAGCNGKVWRPYRVVTKKGHPRPGNPLPQALCRWSGSQEMETHFHGGGQAWAPITCSLGLTTPT